MRLRKSHLTFGKIADEWTWEVAGTPGALNRAEIFHELLKALWRGEFEDEDGKYTFLMLHLPPPGGAWRIDHKFVDKNHMRTAETKPVGFNRRMLLCVLAFDRPHGLPLPPGDRLRGWHSPESDNPEPIPWSELKAEVRWDILDALTLDEYSRTFRRTYLESLTISKDDFGRWCDEHGHTRPAFWFDDEPAGKAASRTVPSRDDGIGKRIQAVLEAAATKRGQNPHLSMAGIANRMAKRDTTEKFEGYGYESIRKILSGTFGPAKERGIRGLGA